VAFLIPDNLGSRKDVPEAVRRVARAFQGGFEDDATVWYEPLFDPAGRHPHLVVLEPRIGIVVLDVVRGKDVPDEPLARADALAGNLRAALDGNDELSHVPVGATAAFPGLERGDVEGLDRCLFRADLDAALVEGEGRPLLQACTRATGAVLDEELTEGQLAALRGVIHPDVIIGGGGAPRPRSASPTPTDQPQPASELEPEREPEPEPEAQDEQGSSLFTRGTGAGGHEPIKVLDRRQEAFAKSLGSGHRVIRGVAGSGKTLVLVHRARLLAKLLPDQPILVTCYTQSLASLLRAQLAEAPNVEVINLDKLMARAIRTAGDRHPGYAEGGRAVAEAALAAQARTRALGYRAVLVDEAQDFDTTALRFCVELLASDDPEQQDLVIVADSAQNIFRKHFRWKDAGIRAQGRTRVLRVNYRNTRQILEFAHAFLTADPTIAVDEVPDAEDTLSVIPAETAERDGPPPRVEVARDQSDEVRLVVEAVRNALPTTREPREIAVLHGDRPSPSGYLPRQLVAALSSAGIKALWVTDPRHRENRNHAGSTDAPVIVSTIQSAKGLEFPHVVVCGVGTSARHDADETTARKLLYVGFTRAVDHLTVVVTPGAPFADDVRQASASSSAG
jgi:hypothetical protein